MMIEDGYYLEVLQEWMEAPTKLDEVEEFNMKFKLKLLT